MSAGLQLHDIHKVHDKETSEMGYMKASFAALLVCVAVQAQAQGYAVFDSIPNPLPASLTSQGFQCCQTAQLGDNIELSDTVTTATKAASVTVAMVTWAPITSATTINPDVGDGSGWKFPITLNLYNVDSGGLGTPITSITQEFLIPWRPEGDSSCPDPYHYGSLSQWRAANGECYYGYAFPITFDLSALDITLPNQLIFGIAYNTNTWGANPLGHGGPFESLNVGLTTADAAVGEDFDKAAAFQQNGGGTTLTAFREVPYGYTPAVQFTTFSVPASADACKKNGWTKLSRKDATNFKNQGACVSYVVNGF